ncbi:DgyrCDS7619 [Dimorphilus gyrociliatus]|uniref:Protein kintoun n=1 Tax=Dimorphilus gyrociliatus TaxID=2664684 RepID=A0A7I8VT95_9ANNE|nr:DgyrCDS7619 [Dimorphilus gyrociliatus]
MAATEHLKETFEKLDLTKDEVDRFTNAFKNEEFRKMFVEYASEIADPENRKKYEEEIAQMEKERGMDVQFVHPKESFVMKTTVNGKKTAYINICSNENIERPKPTREVGGVSWSIPYSLSPVRDNSDKDGKLCTIFDVVYHPDSIRMAETNVKFKEIVKQTAFEGIKEKLGAVIDLKNIKELNNIKYKGTPTATVIRKKKDDFEASKNGPKSTDGIPHFPYPYGEKSSAELAQEQEKNLKTNKDSKKEQVRTQEADDSEYTKPKYTIKHSSNMDLQKYTNSPVSIQNRPDKLIVNIHLPLLKSSKPVDLNIFERKLLLQSESPAKYKLEVQLPYPVDENEGSAKFDKSKTTLSITLHVLPLVEDKIPQNATSVEEVTEANNEGSIDAMVGESEQREAQKVEESEKKDIVEKKAKEDTSATTFEKPSIFVKPEFKVNQTSHVVTFIFNHRNIEKDSLEKEVGDNNITVKFHTLGEGGFPIKYLFKAKFEETIIPDKTVLDVNSDNLVVIIFKTTDRQLSKLLVCGGNDENYEENNFQTEENLVKEVEELSASTELDMENLTLTEEDENYLKFAVDDKNSLTKADIRKGSTHGILKTERSRSISESSLESSLTSSCLSGSLPATPDVELDLSPRPRTRQKSVSFSDQVEEQSYKQNSSVAQLHKTLMNRKKKARKREEGKDKRRRHSSGETVSSSELETDHHLNGDLRRSLSADDSSLERPHNRNQTKKYPDIHSSEQSIDSDNPSKERSRKKKKKKSKNKKDKETNDKESTTANEKTVEANQVSINDMDHKTASAVELTNEIMFELDD